MNLPPPWYRWVATSTGQCQIGAGFRRSVFLSVRTRFRGTLGPPFWKVPAGQQRPEPHPDAQLFDESYQPTSAA